MPQRRNEGRANSRLLLFSPFFLLFAIYILSKTKSYFHQTPIIQSHPRLKVYVADLPRSFNYGLLFDYWSLSDPDSRISFDIDEDRRSSFIPRFPPPFPDNPLIKQYSAEYWLLGDLETPARKRDPSSAAERVSDWRDADVVFVPFFAALSAEMELGWGEKGGFRKKKGNADYGRQKEVVDLVRSSDAWKRSGGRDHVFVLTDPVAMWHVRAEISPAILLVVDFGGWYKLDAKASSSHNGSSIVVQHTQVSLLKDVIVPYTHFLPPLQLMKDEPRHTLLYFKGAIHRHRGGLIREKLWDLLRNERKVIMEEGFPNETSRHHSVIGMRNSEFCLHPAGDTPTSCRLFDAIMSLCIPVIVSDDIELPFEGMVDYSEFSLFVPVGDALQPGWLVQHLRNISKEQKGRFRFNMEKVQSIFEYDNGRAGGFGPVPYDGAVNHIWRKVRQKLPAIKEAVTREKRKVASVPLRCHCV